MEQAKIEEVRNFELRDEFRNFMQVSSNWMAMPLFLAFWIADIIYVPEHKWTFLAIRLTTIPASLLIQWQMRRASTLLKTELLAVIFTSFISVEINLMIYLIGDAGTPYYAGLNLIAIGALSFLPFRRVSWIATTSIVYVPYILISASRVEGWSSIQSLLVNMFFVVGTLVISLLVRVSQERLRRKELQSRVMLKEELENREKIIREKTEEAIHLQALSSQFSPQVVESIRDGTIELDSSARQSEITTLFIDIVNSTERVVHIPKDDFVLVISRFLNTTTKVLLKYDMTVDKFLGDGVLAFANAPYHHGDHSIRAMQAGLEIVATLKEEQQFFSRHWGQEFQVRVGIARGVANVGFFGDSKCFKSFTAIGPVVNLSARLCSTAGPGQVICEQAALTGANGFFDFIPLEQRSLKGFEHKEIFTYEVKAGRQKIVAGVQECPVCGSVLSMEEGPQGSYVFCCRSCGSSDSGLQSAG